MREDGYDAYTALAFDLAVVAYGREFEAAQEATVDVPAPRERRKPTVPKPKYGPEDFKRFLAIPEDDLIESASMVADPVVEEMVDSILSGTADWLWPKDDDA